MSLVAEGVSRGLKVSSWLAYLNGLRLDRHQLAL